MKVFVVLALCCVTVAACNDSGAPSGGSRSKLANRRDSVSYFYGSNMGTGMRRDSVDLNAEMIYAGIRDAMGGDTSAASDSNFRRAAEAFGADLQAKAEARAKATAAAAKMEGEAFLAANKSKPGVVTLPSGLQYKVITEGSGPTPKESDRVMVRYRGTLLNGTAFDSSGNEPVNLGVTQVVPGWQEALQKMKVGSKWQLFIPAALAYGEQSPGGLIGPNAMLLFDLELVGIAPPQPEGQSGMQLTPEQLKQMQQQMQQGGGHP